MPGRRHLLDSLPKRPAPPDDVCDLCLIAVDLNRARPEKIRRRMQVKELCFDVLSLKRICLLVDLVCRFGWELA